MEFAGVDVGGGLSENDVPLGEGNFPGPREAGGGAFGEVDEHFGMG